MEKVIKLKMCNDKSIKIFVDEQEKHSIELQSRSIDAEILYEIIAFAPGTKYSVLSENADELDNQVLDFFVGLFTDIVNKVNSIEQSTDETE